MKHRAKLFPDAAAAAAERRTVPSYAMHSTCRCLLVTYATVVKPAATRSCYCRNLLYAMSVYHHGQFQLRPHRVQLFGNAQNRPPDETHRFTRTEVNNFRLF